METANLSPEAASVENSQCACLWQSAQERWNEGLKRLDARIREKPRQYFLGALAAGYVLQLIPWRALFFVLGVLCLRLLRPILLLVAAIKLTELIERKSSNERVVKDKDTQRSGSDEIEGGHYPSNPLK